MQDFQGRGCIWDFPMQRLRLANVTVDFFFLIFSRVQYFFMARHHLAKARLVQ